MANGRIYNFSAGPSMLPLEVLERAGKEITNYQGSGMSVMEMSHRSKVFQKIFDDTKAKFKKLMAVPDDYEVLFLQGGASTQFSAIPLNLIGSTGKADYAVTGNFSNLAYQEAKKYGDIAVACTSEDQDFSYIPTQDKIVVRPDADVYKRQVQTPENSHQPAWENDHDPRQGKAEETLKQRGRLTAFPRTARSTFLLIMQ